MKRRFLISTAIFALLVFVLATSIFADTSSASSFRTMNSTSTIQNMQAKHHGKRRWHRRWHKRNHHHHGHKKG
ncbi:MAG: hypothetical protein ABI878_08745 [Acidobacteriota bacterium]